jgi:hypothetical protein
MKLALSFGLLALGLCSVVPDACAESMAMTNPYVTISDVQVKEGDSGKTPFTAEVRLLYWHSSTTVRIFATPGTAGSSDYEFEPVELTLSPGAATQTVTGYVVGDIYPETGEYFRLSATGASDAGSYGYGYVMVSGGLVNITDDDPAPGLHVEGANVTEGDEGKKPVDVRVRLEPASPLVVLVNYQLSGAAVGVDYLSDSDGGTLTFQPGEVLKTIPLSVLGNTYWEHDKKIVVTLDRPQNAALGTAKAEVVIANDDPPTHASLADLTLDEGNEGKRIVPITITLDRPAPPNSKLHVMTVDNTAQDGMDFLGGAQILSPELGLQFTYKLVVLGDSDAECDKGFYVHYYGSGLGDDTTGIAKVLLRNDDAPVADCPDPFSFVGFLDGGPKAGGLPDASFNDGGAGDPSPDATVATGGASGGRPEPSPSYDASTPATKLSKRGGCAVAPFSPGGSLPVWVLGLALAWIGRKNRRA